MTGIDFSTLPPPVLDEFDEAANLGARLAKLKQAFADNGLDWEGDRLRADSGTILQGVDNYFEMLDRQMINDVYRESLIPYASGDNLDQLAATRHYLARHPGEDDDDFKRRLQFEGERKNGGKPGGYAGDLMALSPEIRHVDAWVDRPKPFEDLMIAAIGKIGPEPMAPAAFLEVLREQLAGRNDPADIIMRLAVQTKGEDPVPSAALMDLVHAHLANPLNSQTTDIVQARPVDTVAYAVDGTLVHHAGPDGALLREQSEAALELATYGRMVPGMDMPRAALIAAGLNPAAHTFILHSPAEDVVCGRGQVAHCTSVTLRSEVINA